MQPSHSELIQLMEDAERAYQRVRVLVIDQLPPGEALDEASLRVDQRMAVIDLRTAEQAVQDYRDAVYGAPRLSVAGLR